MPAIYHDGELVIQARAGALAQARSNGQIVRDTIIPGAIKFIARQPFIVLASIDRQQNLWASIAVGQTGFMIATPSSVEIDLSLVHRAKADPLWQNLATESRLGMLVIDLRSRARLRVNGRIRNASKTQLHVDVDQAYPNCPQYIQRRIYRPAVEQQPTSVSTTGTKLNTQQQRWIARADTLFVASGRPSNGLDASHRGGRPGFVQIMSPTRLRIPDYSGNGMFNTLGNFAIDPRAGIVVPDFEGGRTLQLTGHTTLLWDTEDPDNDTGGTGRYWDFEIDRWIETDRALPGWTEFLDYSPRNPQPNVSPRNVS